MPVLPACILNPIRVAFLATLPKHIDTHPLRCHNPRTPDEVVFDSLIDHLVSGMGYEKVAGPGCSASTIRRRRNEWNKLGVFANLKHEVQLAYQKMIGYDLNQVAGDGCITKAPNDGDVAGPSPVDRRKQGTKRSQAVDGDGVAITTPTAPANVPDHYLLPATLDRVMKFTDQIGASTSATTVRLDAGYDNRASYAALADRDLDCQVSPKGEKTPINKTERWKVERVNSWMNDFGLLRRMTEKAQGMVDLFIDLAEIVVTVRCLVVGCWEGRRHERGLSGLSRPSSRSTHP